MSLHNFEKHLNKANAFMKSLSLNLGTEDKEKVYRIFKSVLHALRDSISMGESLQLIAQLPFILKATYVEGWTTRNKKLKIRHIEDFISKVKEKDSKTFEYDFINKYEVERACRIIFSTLGDFISEGEMKSVQSILPAEIKYLFDNEVVLI